MGIPVFFKTVITDYNHVIEPVTNQPIDTIFFDLNCLIHPCCAQVEDGCENTMISSIIETIHTLIQLTGASFIYIAIDGPAPKAKMIQQRIRRHKSVLESKQWDTNAITPGTLFMNKLNVELHKIFDIRNDVIVSDSLEPGEGEHKILQYLKQNKSNFKNKPICIYGLDADLIMLSLVSGISNIYLLRERTSFNIEQMDGEYLYLKIDGLKQEITSSFPAVPKQVVVNDYIFMCFLLGNDFTKHSPSLILRYDGLNHILNIYKQCQETYANKFYLINPNTKGVIHWSNLKIFIHGLSITEDTRIFDIYSIRLKQHSKYRRIYDNIQKNNHTIQVKPYNNNFPVEDIMRHKPVIFMDDEIKIFASADWTTAYNTYTLTGYHDLYPVNELNGKVSNLCYHYIQSLVWTTQYYFKECMSQEWYYPYEFAPTLKDLYIYLQKEKRVHIKPSIHIYSSKEQLEFIFPKQSYGLSNELDDETTVKEFTGFEKEYTLLKRYDWECEPLFTD